MNLPKRSSFKSLLNVYTLSEILLRISLHIFLWKMRATAGACIKSGCLARRPLCYKVNLPGSCEARRPLCHKVNLLSCVARRPLFHKVNLPRCEARRRLFLTFWSLLDSILWYILFTFIILFLHYISSCFCSVFIKTVLLSDNPQIQDFFSCLLLWWKTGYIQIIP